MLMAGFRGLAVWPEHPVIRDIRQHHLGAVVLFDYDVPLSSSDRNIESVAQVQKLISVL